ncbi:DUF3097 domain-containing protein [Protofrankia symbiont of Coriaria ruscifolia]|uniref:DUF3097 domain-containing protein n=1 Tax=Protofrankia symbiont of Coriaria ruscifolia TaxID=1306542 RepID=UPI000AF74C4E|nr:DUF3097 domain-containing protein [Protofrankia symbiont of Coriaria ruscifolia]
MRSRDYGPDVLAQGRRVRPASPPTVEAEPDLVVEDAATGFCGAVVEVEAGGVVLEDRHGRRRAFPLATGAFLLDGRTVTLIRPQRSVPAAPARTASGSIAVRGQPARVARASRIYVEGLHDAALVERVWGDDLRVEGVVVESLDGVDDLPALVASFRPGPRRSLGVLVDHLVAGSKESRIAASVTSPYVLVTGHPYVDIWQAVKPASVGIAAWPQVPRDQPWKEGVCRALGVAEPADMWRRVLSSVHSYTDIEVGLLGAVERLIDFVTAPVGDGDDESGGEYGGEHESGRE